MKARIKSPYNGPFEWDQIPYKVRFAELSIDQIYNNIAPPPSQVEADAEFYEKLLESVSREGIRNPVCLTSARLLSKEEMDARAEPDHEANHNWPRILRYYDIGWGEHLQFARKRMPHPWRDTDAPLLACHHQGGSRLWAAAIVKCPVPAIISDFCAAFDHAPLIDSDESLRSCFHTPPNRIILGRVSPLFGIPHIHMGHERAEDRHAKA